jgi:hypothetical protein
MTIDQWGGQPADILSHIEPSPYLHGFRDWPDRSLRYRAGPLRSHRQDASAVAVVR